MLTFLPIEEINAMDGWEGAQLNTAKSILAYELTKLVHGEEEAEKAKAQAEALFGAGGAADAPTAEMLDEDFYIEGKTDILTMLVRSGLCKSKSEARQAVQQGGVSVDGEKVSDVKALITKEQLEAGILVKRGKKSFMKFVLKA
jgi:tyrosyl-tRNA synthetase